MILTPREIARIGLSHRYPDELYNARATRKARRAFRHRDTRRTRRQIDDAISDHASEEG
ncbi:hypothetical protein [Streptomyces regalis]|uniref:hypothetical protein n=1 Tax=Streptomyces regalis TaxID=68262 RepID=UPI000A93DC08|nr:hypothetical protein [Streptomyces regalis]